MTFSFAVSSGGRFLGEFDFTLRHVHAVGNVEVLTIRVTTTA
jgi:hypothetical protein